MKQLAFLYTLTSSLFLFSQSSYADSCAYLNNTATDLIKTQLSKEDRHIKHARFLCEFDYGATSADSGRTSQSQIDFAMPQLDLALLRLKQLDDNWDNILSEIQAASTNGCELTDESHAYIQDLRKQTVFKIVFVETCQETLRDSKPIYDCADAEETLLTEQQKFSDFRLQNLGLASAITHYFDNQEAKRPQLVKSPTKVQQELTKMEKVMAELQAMDKTYFSSLSDFTDICLADSAIDSLPAVVVSTRYNTYQSNNKQLEEMRESYRHFRDYKRHLEYIAMEQ